MEASNPSRLLLRVLHLLLDWNGHEEWRQPACTGVGSLAMPQSAIVNELDVLLFLHVASPLHGDPNS